MRCKHCGFVSFDHLSACGRCGGDLTAIREGLGFPDSAPNPPNLLGPLLKRASGADPGPRAGGKGFEDGEDNAEETGRGREEKADTGGCLVSFEEFDDLDLRMEQDEGPAVREK